MDDKRIYFTYEKPWQAVLMGIITACATAAGLLAVGYLSVRIALSLAWGI